MHLKFLALALEVASHIEGKRVPKEKGVVHSYRFLPDVESGVIFDRRYGCGSISFEVVLSTLLSNGINPDTVNEILSILRWTSNGRDCGLPVGGNASRIIAEAVLNWIDQVLIENNLDFVRFVDDFVFFPEREMEIKVLSLVKDIFGSFGLGIIYRKLKITGTSEVLAESDFFRNLPLYDGEVQSPDIGLAVKNYYRQIRNIERDKCLNVGLLKVIGKDRGAVIQIMPSLCHFLGYMSRTFRKVARWIIDSQEILDVPAMAGVHNAVINLFERKHGILSNEINLAFAIRLLGLGKSEKAMNILAALFLEKADKPLIASSIIFVMGQWDQHDWLMDRLGDFDRMSGWERRSLIMANGDKYDFGGERLKGVEGLLVG